MRKKKKNKPSKRYSEHGRHSGKRASRNKRARPESEQRFWNRSSTVRFLALQNDLSLKANKFLIFIFLFLLPTQLGKHFFLPFSYLNGVRVDYLAPTIYLTDILAFLIIFVNLKTVIKFFSNKKILLALVLLLINIVFSKSVGISVYRYIKIVEFLAVFSIVKDLFNYLKAKTILVGFLLSGLFQLILSLFQLIYNRSFQGLFYYFGERLVSLSSPGVAKATIQGKEFLRPYATFSHPNSLAGFFLLLYFFVLIDKRFNKYSLLKYSSLFVFTVLIFLSFSKVAIITFLILNTIYYLLSTNLSCRLCKIARISIPIIVSLFFLQAITDPMTINKRFELMRNSVAIILENPLFGVGLGSYLIAQADFVSKFYLFFNQPVHNIFLLFIVETGIIVGPMVFVLIYRSIKRIWTLNRYIFLAIVMTGLLDHYWLTLQQNFMAMAMVIGASLIRFSPES